MKITDLTQEEKELILEKRREEERIRWENTPQRYGYLKKDMYTGFDFGYRGSYLNLPVPSIVSREKLQKLLIEKLDTLILVPKGTKFAQYEIDGEKLWFDNENIGVESKHQDWANKHLENIHLSPEFNKWMSNMEARKNNF